MVVEELEARIVRMIYRWYTEGDGEGGPLTVSAIARKLSQMEIPTFADTDPHNRGGEKKRGWAQWRRSSVNKMLKSETCAGVWWYGKFNNGGVKKGRNPVDSLLSVEVPAIVTRTMWDAAQARMAENRGRAGRMGKS